MHTTHTHTIPISIQVHFIPQRFKKKFLLRYIKQLHIISQLASVLRNKILTLQVFLPSSYLVYFYRLDYKTFKAESTFFAEMKIINHNIAETLLLTVFKVCTKLHIFVHRN